MRVAGASGKIATAFSTNATISKKAGNGAKVT
jgi:hypothetical protein